MVKYNYAGNFLGHKILLERGEGLDWTYKVPIFFMRIIPIWLGLEKCKCHKKEVKG